MNHCTRSINQSIHQSITKESRNNSQHPTHTQPIRRLNVGVNIN
jgi:hypothetical protein